MERKLRKTAEEILQYIYDHTDKRNFVSTGELEIQFGLDPSAVRCCIEDLKEQILIFESERGLQISESGTNYARSRWV